MNKYPKNWHDNLLLSSLPLELITQEALIRNKYSDYGEGIIERDGKHFSIDMKMERYIDLSDFQDADYFIPIKIKICLFVECKYLRTPRCIVFGGFKDTTISRNVSFNSVDLALINDTAISILPDKKYINYDMTRELETSLIPSSIPSFQKGTILANEANPPDTLYKAQNQLSYILLNEYINNLYDFIVNYQPISDNRIRIRDFISKEYRKMTWYIPIIVTNAPLFGIQKNIGMKEIEKAKSFESFTKLFQCIHLSIPPLSNLPTLFQNDINKISQRIKHNNFDEISSINSAYRLIRYIPSRFYIINPSALDTFIHNLEYDIMKKMTNVFISCSQIPS
jgi:hypothetical protein